MCVRRIEWLAVLLPAGTVLLFEFVRHRFMLSFLPMSTGNVATAIIAGAVVYGFVRLFKRLLERSADEVARTRTEKAVMLERQRIAREMHDSVAQALFFLGVKLRETEALVREGGREQACSEIRRMQGYTEDAYRLVKSVIADLKKQEDERDFCEEVRLMALQTSEQLSMTIQCDIASAELPPVVRRHLLAIIQEALLNAHRHGRAHKANVRVRRENRDLVVEISDDGTGFDPSKVQQDGHYGLTIMAERASMIGGALHVQSAPGRGTRIAVHLMGGIPG